MGGNKKSIESISLDEGAPRQDIITKRGKKLGSLEQAALSAPRLPARFANREAVRPLGGPSGGPLLFDFGQAIGRKGQYFAAARPKCGLRQCGYSDGSIL
jgi:hypothetical protein